MTILQKFATKKMVTSLIVKSIPNDISNKWIRTVTTTTAIPIPQSILAYIGSYNNKNNSLQCNIGIKYNHSILRKNILFRRTQSRFISSTKFTMEKIIVKVPTMGDSITEGTIVEWTAALGQAVQTDDVIALIETDKVTIDIKAEVNGVITQYFGSVDETVEVGAKLYEIDTEAIASVTTEATSAPLSVDDSESKESESVQEMAAPTAPIPEHRSPSIKFLGKDGWEALKKGHDMTKTVLNGSVPTNSTKVSPHAVSTIVDDISVKDPMYGRPKFTEAEIEALLTGGATLAPQVLSHSTGAKFKL